MREGNYSHHDSVPHSSTQRLLPAFTAAVVIGSILGGAPASAAPATTTIDTPGIYTCTVSAGTTSLSFVALGGGGGAGDDPVTAGGAGAEVIGTLSVSPGDVLTLNVASGGASILTSPGGGGGGGATTITNGSTVVVIAGGGGGGAGGTPGYNGAAAGTSAGGGAVAPTRPGGGSGGVGGASVGGAGFADGKDWVDGGDGGRAGTFGSGDGAVGGTGGAPGGAGSNTAAGGGGGGGGYGGGGGGSGGGGAAGGSLGPAGTTFIAGSNGGTTGAGGSGAVILGNECVFATSSTSTALASSEAAFHYYTPDGIECTAISPAIVTVGSMTALPGAEAPCSSMPNSTITGWFIATASDSVMFGSRLNPFPPGQQVHVIESQRFTAILSEPTLTFLYDANVAMNDACAPNVVADSNIEARTAQVWVPRADIAQARFPLAAACTPPRYVLSGWTDRVTGKVHSPGSALPSEWSGASTNRRTLYAAWGAG